MDLNFKKDIATSTVKLSQRQRQCLQLVEAGMTSKEVGRALDIAPSTVDNHIQAACDRLGAKNRTDAIRLYRKVAIPLTGSPDGDSPLVTQPTNDAEGVKPDASLIRLLFTPPPIGGRKNDLPTNRRIFHIVQIALFAIAAMTAAILTIAGLVHILSAPQ